VTTPAKAATASQEAAGVAADEKPLPPVLAENDRIAKLRAHLTLSDNPDLARRVLKYLDTQPFAVVREEFEHRWGRDGAEALSWLLEAKLVTTITRGWTERIRPSHLVNDPRIYDEPEILRRAAIRPVRVPVERVTYQPGSGFVLNVEGPLHTCIDWGIAALVGQTPDGDFRVVVPHRVDFAQTSREEFAARGAFTVLPTVFRARMWRRIKPGVRCFQLVNPDQAVPGKAQRVLV
jgi:hypothetical protein